MRIEDEGGGLWAVLPGDPAAPMVNALKRLNYGWVVLTTRLLCGIMAVPTDEPSPPVAAHQNGAADVRGIRLSDCLAALKKEGLIDGA